MLSRHFLGIQNPCAISLYLFVSRCAHPKPSSQLQFQFQSPVHALSPNDGPVSTVVPPASTRELAPPPVSARGPVIDAKPIRELPITYMDPLDSVGSPTIGAPSEIETSTPFASTMTIARDTQLPESILSVPSGSLVSAPRSVGPVVPPAGLSSPIDPPETLPTISPLVAESTPSTLIPSRRTASPVTQDAEEFEMRRAHDFQEKQAERDHEFVEKQAEWDRHFQDTLAPQPGPPGSALPEGMLELPERAESVIALIRRAFTETAAHHADDIRGIVQGEREEMARQLQAEREEARAEREALEQQVLAERQRADDERDARTRELEEELVRVREDARADKEALERQVLAERRRADNERDAQTRELEEELARVRAELDHERQQRNHDEEMRREVDSQKNLECDEETKQQLGKITDPLLAHREEFARKKEAVDERWNGWRDETNNQFQGLFNMVQGVMDSCAEQKERCEQERLAAEQKPCKWMSLLHNRVLTISQRLRMS